MRKIINSTYVSLDGVIENPQDWPSPDVEDQDAGAIQTELLLACDAVLMGRRTYDGFAPVWPTRSGDPYSDHINAMPKYVVSSTLRNPEWNNTRVIGDDPVAAIRRLKEQPGKDIVQYGFGRLSYTLLDHGLIDELRLWVHPFFVRDGGSLYREGPPAGLDLIGARPLKSGIVILSYRAKTGLR
ncbi:MAG: dihydrofolate reductase family protein [Actinoallomurus sp.]